MYIVTATKTDYIIVNIETLRSRKIGRIGKGRGVNYMDRAKEEATKRNNGVQARYIPKWQFDEILNGTRTFETLKEMVEAV
jgi:hypothetical protein